MALSELNRGMSSQDRAYWQARNNAARTAASQGIFAGLSERALIPKGGTFQHVPGYGMQPVYRTAGARRRAEWVSSMWEGAHVLSKALKSKTKEEKQREKKQRKAELKKKIIENLFGGVVNVDAAPPTAPLNAKRASMDPRFMPSLDPDYAKNLNRQANEPEAAQSASSPEPQAAPKPNEDVDVDLPKQRKTTHTFSSPAGSDEQQNGSVEEVDVDEPLSQRTTHFGGTIFPDPNSSPTGTSQKGSANERLRQYIDTQSRLQRIKDRLAAERPSNKKEEPMIIDMEPVESQAKDSQNENKLFSIESGQQPVEPQISGVSQDVEPEIGADYESIDAAEAGRDTSKPEMDGPEMTK